MWNTNDFVTEKRWHQRFFIYMFYFLSQKHASKYFNKNTIKNQSPYFKNSYSFKKILKLSSDYVEWDHYLNL